ncbi:hypothetical protein VCV18_003842 [Metarhizium anisopliae]
MRWEAKEFDRAHVEEHGGLSEGVWRGKAGGEGERQGSGGMAAWGNEGGGVCIHNGETHLDISTSGAANCLSVILRQRVPWSSSPSASKLRVQVPTSAPPTSRELADHGTGFDSTRGHLCGVLVMDQSLPCRISSVPCRTVFSWFFYFSVFPIPRWTCIYSSARPRRTDLG